MKNGLLMFAAVASVGVLAFTWIDQSQSSAETDARICQKVNKLDDVIVALLERSQKSLPSNVFYRGHPELLKDALRQNARALREFRSAAC